MSRPPRSSLALAVFALLATLALPSAAAAATHSSAAAPAPSASAGVGFSARLRTWLGAIFPDLGCLIDPNGKCVPASTAPRGRVVSPDLGCGIDPSGKCLQEPAAPHAGILGRGIDPDRRVLPPASTLAAVHPGPSSVARSIPTAALCRPLQGCRA
jgi:hypothetical protein